MVAAAICLRQGYFRLGRLRYKSQALSIAASSSPLKLVLKTPEEGCRPLIYALLAPRLSNGGYVVDCELRDIAPLAKSVRAQEALWEWTGDWVASALAAEAAVNDAGGFVRVEP